MRKYIDRQTGELGDLRCNKCGRKIRLRNGFPEEGVFHADNSWGFFSRRDGENHSFDLCEDCYDEWIRSFEIGVEIEERVEML